MNGGPGIIGQGGRLSGSVETGTQRDKLIEELKRTDALLEYTVRHGEDAEAERLRAKLHHLAERM